MKVPAELKIKYLVRRLQDVAIVKTSMDQEDFSIPQRVGHQVKGNALTFDMPQIAWIGEEMEKAAICRDKDKITGLVREMEETLRFVQAKF